MSETSTSPARPDATPFQQWRRRMRDLYEGNTAQTRWFLYGLLAFDFVSLLFIIATSFLPRSELIRTLDLVFGVIFLVEFIARFAAIRRPLREVWRFTTWTDIAAIGSLLASASGEAAGFLRVLRTLRLLRTFRVVEHLRRDSALFRRHEDVVSALANLSVFIFVMTGVVYETQRYSNPQIANYADALYFTVTALTTTGFGDITLQGPAGKLTSVVVMIVGISLFVRLAQAIFRPSKVSYRCPTCALLKHDYDAVHCKACGEILCIPDEDE